MKSYLFKRILQLIPMLLGITLITFFIINLTPGEPTALLMDPQMTGEDLLRIKQNLGLDKPLIIQYFIWLKNLLQGNLGYSHVTTRPVLSMILERLPSTLLLMISAMILTFLCAVPLGIWSALKRGRRFDRFVTVFSFVGMSIPGFWLCLVGILVFSLKLGLLPSFGMIDIAVRDSNVFIRAVNIIWHMILPLSVMIITGLAGLIRYQRSSMLNVLDKTYIKAAKARGIPSRVIIYRHAMKNALLPLITIIGLSLPTIFGGTVIIEKIFAWPGMGMLGMNAIFSRDYPLIMGIILFSSFLVLIGNLIADLLYSWADPRIVYEK